MSADPPPIEQNKPNGVDHAPPDMEELGQYVANKKEERLLMKFELIEGMLKKKPKATQAELNEYVKNQLVECLFQHDLRKTTDQAAELAVDDIESKNASLQQQIVTLQGQLAQVKGQRPRARQQNNKSQQHFFAATLVARHLLKEKERVQMDIEYLRWARDATLTRAFDFFSRSLDADPNIDFGGIFNLKRDPDDDGMYDPGDSEEINAALNPQTAKAHAEEKRALQERQNRLSELISISEEEVRSDKPTWVEIVEGLSEETTIDPEPNMCSVWAATTFDTSVEESDPDSPVGTERKSANTLSPTAKTPIPPSSNPHIKAAQKKDAESHKKPKSFFGFFNNSSVQKS